MNSHEVFIHIHQGCFAGTGAIVRLPQCQWSKPDGFGKISQCITTTKHSKAKTVCIFLGIYCMCSWLHVHGQVWADCTYFTATKLIKSHASLCTPVYVMHGLSDSWMIIIWSKWKKCDLMYWMIILIFACQLTLYYGQCGIMYTLNVIPHLSLVFSCNDMLHTSVYQPLESNIFSPQRLQRF